MWATLVMSFDVYVISLLPRGSSAKKPPHAARMPLNVRRTRTDPRFTSPGWRVMSLFGFGEQMYRMANVRMHPWAKHSVGAERVVVDPPRGLLAGMFMTGLLSSYVFCTFNRDQFALGPDGSYAAMDRVIDRITQGAERDQQRAVEMALEGANLSPIDWATVATQLLRTGELDYAANAFYIAYLGSDGEVAAYKDWMQQALLQQSEEGDGAAAAV